MRYQIFELHNAFASSTQFISTQITHDISEPMVRQIFAHKPQSETACSENLTLSISEREFRAEKKEHYFKEQLSFDSMKNNPMVNWKSGLEKLECITRDANPRDTFRFIRCGRAGQWRDVMSLTMIERFQKWGKENLTEIADCPLLLES